jgi:hypothetical protein
MIGFLFLVLCLGASRESLAQGIITVPGSICFGVKDSLGSDVPTPGTYGGYAMHDGWNIPDCSAGRPSLIYNQFGVENQSACWQRVLCPLTARPRTTGGPMIPHLTVWLYDRSPTSPVSCTVFTSYNDGNIVFASTKSTAAGFAGGLTGFDWANLPGSFVSVQCDLPPSAQNGDSFITAITMSE